MKVETEIDDLRQRHHTLDGEIEVESTLVCPDEIRISSLKKEKLKIKDLIRELETSG
ncbi:MAG: YdcH family protein [Alphaproteobacteria bacterium]|nr:YdcH family protein [Alphaproteobacteria bacterium]